MTPEEVAEKVVATWGVWVHDVYLEQDELRSLIASALRDAYERGKREGMKVDVRLAAKTAYEESAEACDTLYDRGPDGAAWSQLWGSGVLDAAAAIRALKGE